MHRKDAVVEQQVARVRQLVGASWPDADLVVAEVSHDVEVVLTDDGGEILSKHCLGATQVLPPGASEHSNAASAAAEVGSWWSLISGSLMLQCKGGNEAATGCARAPASRGVTSASAAGAGLGPPHPASTTSTSTATRTWRNYHAAPTERP